MARLAVCVTECLDSADRTVYEVLRVHSSTFSMRLAKDDIELPSSSGQSTTVRKGELILVANMAAHYDDDCFEGADEFRPNRFVQADGTCASSSHLRVWGAGAGICKGRVFAQFNEASATPLELC